MKEGQITLGVFTDDPIAAELPAILQQHCGFGFCDQSSNKMQLGELGGKCLPRTVLYKVWSRNKNEQIVGPYATAHGLLVSSDFWETVKGMEQFSDYLSGKNGAMQVQIGDYSLVLLPRNDLNGQMADLCKIKDYLNDPVSMKKKYLGSAPVTAQPVFCDFVGHC